MSFLPSPVRAVLLGAALLLTGCTVLDPASGARQFSLVTPEQERAMGKAENPKVLETFGGAYADQRVQDYVERVGKSIVRVSELPQEGFTFVVLNSDIVNAMALPGGYVYVTRGLLALADSEAELAGVLAHEIGHVTARHTAERVTQSVAAQLGLAILGAVVGNPDIANLASVGAGAYLQKYSRDQEFEADSLGLRYLARAGYEPRAMASFLASLRRWSALEAQQAGRSPDSVDEFDLMASHPRTAERVERAMQESVPGAPPGRLNREDYLRHIDGLLFGDDPAKGMVRGREFLHPRLGFRFTVPPGFRVVNTDEAVTARHRSGALIIFDAAPMSAPDIVTYLSRGWVRGAQLEQVERFSVDGMPAATGVTRARTEAGMVDLRLVAIQFDRERVYRFMFATPPAATAALADELRATATSFARLPPAEAERARGWRLDVVAARPGDTPERVMGPGGRDPLAMQRFLALNDLQPGQPIEPGRPLKVVR